MDTVVKVLIGIHGEEVPQVIPEEVDFPCNQVELFNDYCGAGEGLFNTLVPEKVWGIPISPACFIHDRMWAMADASWCDFHYSNSVFLSNINALISYQSRSKCLKRIRMYRAVTYYNAVDSIGSEIFWRMKRV